MTGQVIKIQGGLVQVLRGWRPVSQSTDEAEWSLDTIAKVAPKLFESVPQGVPRTRASVPTGM